MKNQTALILDELILAKRFTFHEVDGALELEYDLTDSEKLQLVNAEYGTKHAAPVEELFLALMRKVIKLSVDKARQDLTEKLSEL